MDGITLYMLGTLALLLVGYILARGALRWAEWIQKRHGEARG